MTQQSLNFDVDRERNARDAGMLRAAEIRRGLLDLAKLIAEMIARDRGEVCADDVQARLMELGHKPRDLGNAAGMIFRGPQWEFVRWTKSSRAGSHRNDIRVWRLRS